MITVKLSSNAGSDKSEHFEVELSRPVSAEWLNKVIKAAIGQSACWACGDEWAVSPRDFGHGMCQVCFDRSEPIQKAIEQPEKLKVGSVAKRIFNRRPRIVSKLAKQK